MTDIDGLHQIELAGGMVSAYLVEADGGRVLVDAGVPGSEAELGPALERIGGPAPDLILLTHAHIDHTGALGAMIATTGAPTAAHPLEAELLSTGEVARPRVPAPYCPDELREMIKQHMTIDPVAIDVMLDGPTVPNFPSLRVIPTPGHAAGHVALLWDHDGGVLIAGDAAVNYGQVMVPPIAEDYDVTNDSLRMLAELDFEHAVFGHGGPIVGGAKAAFAEACAGERCAGSP